MKISSKKLSNTDMNHVFSMESRSLKYLPPFVEGQNTQDLWVEDEDGIEWQFRLIIRRGKYTKPVLSAGWIQFVRKKNLQNGYKVQFFREVDEASGQFVYKIKLKKPVVVFKSVLGYAPYRAGN